MTGCECAHTVEHNHTDRSENTHLIAALAPHLLQAHFPYLAPLVKRDDFQLKNNPVSHAQTGRGDWALGWWEVGATRDRAVRLGMPAWRCRKPCKTVNRHGGGFCDALNASGRGGRGGNS